MAARLTVLRALDKLDRLGASGVRYLLGDGRKDESGDFTKGAGLASEQIELLLAFPTIEIHDVPMDPTKSGGILWRLAPEYADRVDTQHFLKSARFAEGMGELVAIRQIVRASGFADDRVRFDFSVVRGLEYYTGVVFEAQLLTPSGASFGSVGGGGRYDDLVARFRGEKIPATGFSIGVSRLAALLREQEATVAAGPVVVLVMDQARVADALAMANELRAAGVRAEAYLGAAGMKAQLKYADKRAAPIAVIQGGDELAKGVVTLKDLKLGAKIAAGLGEDREAYAKAREQVQQEAPRDQLVAAVQQMLAR